MLYLPLLEKLYWLWTVIVVAGLNILYANVV